jgi:hypothetical protein
VEFRKEDAFVIMTSIVDNGLIFFNSSNFGGTRIPSLEKYCNVNPKRDKKRG